MIMRPPHSLALAFGIWAALSVLTAPAAAQPLPASAPAGHPGAAPAAASQPAALTAPGAAAPTDPGFKPLAPGESAAPPDSISASDLVTVAYSLIWLAVVVFLVGLWRRNRRLGDEVAALRARLERNPSGN
jgi:hypothetical protein